MLGRSWEAGTRAVAVLLGGDSAFFVVLSCLTSRICDVGASCFITVSW